MMTKHEMKKMEALKAACRVLIDAYASGDRTGSIEWEQLNLAFECACEAMPDAYAEALEFLAETEQTE